MRVKISYGINIEDLPEEVDHLFTPVFDQAIKLSSQVKSIDSLLDDDDTEAALSLMNKMRETMAEMDFRLADLTAILEGYNNYTKQEVNNDLYEGRPTLDSSSGTAVSGTKQSSSSEVQQRTESSFVSREL